MPGEILSLIAGVSLFEGDYSIDGYSVYMGIGIGFGIPFADIGHGVTVYKETTFTALTESKWGNKRYGIPGNPTEDEEYKFAYASEIINDVMNMPLLGYDRSAARVLRDMHLRDINKYVQAFNGIQIESYK